jgi:hypothetical protein
MRPDIPFRFVNGKLVVEAEVSASIEEYGPVDSIAWPELVVSTSPQPTGHVVDDLYSYGQFGGFWTVGCRLQSSRWPICAMYDNTGRVVSDARGSGRVLRYPVSRVAARRTHSADHPFRVGRTSGTRVAPVLPSAVAWTGSAGS